MSNGPSGPPPDNASKFAPVTAARTSFKADEAGNGKVVIGSIDDPAIFVEAQFNPKELEIARSVPWQKATDTNKANGRGGSGAGAGAQGIQLEFNGAEGRSLSLELLFDDYEAPAPGRVTAAVQALEKMASVREPGSNKEEMKRPHRCLAVWGTALPPFKCVIESLSTKYTMFNAAGVPLRATCTVKLKEADAVKVAKKK